MGYVLRCLKLEVAYTNKQTYIKENGELIKLELRGQKNNDMNSVYPKLFYTLSLADMMKPKACE